jgi:hypothetical protein
LDTTLTAASTIIRLRAASRPIALRKETAVAPTDAMGSRQLVVKAKSNPVLNPNKHERAVLDIEISL